METEGFDEPECPLNTAEVRRCDRLGLPVEARVGGHASSLNQSANLDRVFASFERLHLTGGNALFGSAAMNLSAAGLGGRLLASDS